MKVTLPEKVTGARDGLFVLEVEFPVASAERVVEVGASGPVEPLDLSGSSRGGTYRIPVGLERLHVPMRVLEDGEGEAKVTVTCTEGPESGTTEERTVEIEAGSATGGRSGRWIGVAAAILIAAAGAWGLDKLGVFGGSDGVPDLANLSSEEAQTALEDAGLLMVPRYKTVEDESLSGVVLRTVPPAGGEIPDSKMVEVVLGKASGSIPILPAVVGAKESDAIDALRAVGYREMVNYQNAESPDQVGVVLDQSPEEGQPLGKGSMVEIWVGRDADATPTEVPMLPDPGPGVADLPEPPAIEPGPSDLPEPPAIEPGPSDLPEPPAIEPGPSDLPEPPPVDPGPTEIPTLPPADPDPLVPEPIAASPAPLVADRDGVMVIPDMRGWTRQKAEDDLRAAGLVPIITLEPPPTADAVGKVIRQRPVGGERRPPAAMIFVTVGEGTPVAADPATPGPEPLPPGPEPLPPGPEPLPPGPGPLPPGPEPLPPGPEPLPPGPGPLPPGPEPLPPGPEPLPPGPEPLPPGPEPLPPGPEPLPPGPEPLPPGPEPLPPGPGPLPPDPAAPFGPDEARPVADVVGMPREKAEGVIRQLGFLYHVVLKVTEYPSDGTVLGQDPAPGVSLPPGGEVVIEVAKAPADAKIVVPGVVGIERDVAERMLRDAGFLVNVTLAGGAPTEQGLVLDQAPRGEVLAPRRSWVEIVVASGTGLRRTARGGPPASAVRPPERLPLPDRSSGLPGPSTTGDGPVRMPQPTPRGPTPLPAVELPPRTAPKTARVPAAIGTAVPDAIAAVLSAGLIPIIEVDRNTTDRAGTVLRQSPDGGTGALPGDLIRLAVAAGPSGGRLVNLPTTVGALVPTAQRMFARTGTALDVVEVRVPGHPYAGTGRVAAQYPVSSMPITQAGRVTVWVVTR